MGNKCKILTLLAIYFIAISCKQNNNQKMQEANTTFGWSALDTGKIEKDYKYIRDGTSWIKTKIK